MRRTTVPPALAVLVIAAAAVAMPPTTRPAEPPASPPSMPPATTRPAPPVAPRSDALELARRIEQAHGLEAWRSKSAVRAALEIEFGGSRILSGTMLHEPHSGRVRIDVADGPTLVFDGERAWVSPAEASMPRARFHLLTWPYFLALPFKLRDPGTTLGGHELRRLDERLCRSLRLTFGRGVGDTPDDWYVIYADPRTGHLRAAAYIVTYGTPKSEAEREPHAIVYGGERTVDGVVLATEWTFHEWSESGGIHGEPLGRARLRDIEFTTAPAGAFDRPKEAREDELPDP